MPQRRDWTRNEQLSTFFVYCRTVFGRLHGRNPGIVELAGRIGRTPAAVAMKACNFANLDPTMRARGVSGLGNVAEADRALWAEFLANPSEVADQAAAAYEAAMGGVVVVDDVVGELERAAAEGARGASRGPGGVDGERSAPAAAERPGHSSALVVPSGPTEVETTVRARRVQSFFRASVLVSYEFRCAWSGLAVPELLVASHIIPWALNESRRADPHNAGA